MAKPHPYGVRPSGNALFDGITECRTGGLGMLRVLEDDLLLDLLSYCDIKTLARLSQCSKAAYVFAHCEDLFKTIVLNSRGGAIDFDRTWRNTAIRLATAHPNAGEHIPIDVKGLYSDLLFRAHMVSVTEVDPRWLSLSNIPRVGADDLSPGEFSVR